MKIFFRILLSLIFVLSLVLIINTLKKTSKQFTNSHHSETPAINDTVYRNLAKALTFRTVSYADPALLDSVQFYAFIEFVRNTYPEVHKNLSLEMINEFALLYKWEGTDSSLKPALLMGHYDVVPVIQGTEQYWENPPFSGNVKDDFIYGRGAMDDKTTVIAILEALEYLVAKGYKPRRSYYIAFGHDEEVLGRYGAASIAKKLQEREISLEFVVDEGGIIKTDGMAGLSKAVALVGVAEKGYVTLQLTATGEGGHSSMPPPQTSIGMLAEAIDRLQKRPFKAGLGGATGYMLDYIAPEMPFMKRLAMSNTWITGGILQSSFAQSNSGNAMIRTTIAPTILDAGIKENVLPVDAIAKINFRILPGNSVEEVIAHVRKAINNDKINIEIVGNSGTEPSMVSDTASVGFRLLHRTIKELFPEVLVAPYLVVGATDSRYFTGLTSSIYRFMPIRLSDEDLKRVHGTNERIHKNDFINVVAFYAELILNDDGK
ncbi:MAG: M20/M25/M40 family metallo-hydrolase [Saprospiraceae bacterium]|nr:M20/M25/M40 family metallo-hydrolase [Saprospiraceae bacterium]